MIRPRSLGQRMWRRSRSMGWVRFRCRRMRSWRRRWMRGCLSWWGMCRVSSRSLRWWVKSLPRQRNTWNRPNHSHEQYSLRCSSPSTPTRKYRWSRCAPLQKLRFGRHLKHSSIINPAYFWRIPGPSTYIVNDSRLNSKKKNRRKNAR